MTDRAAFPSDASLIAATAPLRSIDASDRIAAPPSRRPMGDGRECLVLWRPESMDDDWSLVLYGRPSDASDTQTPVARLALHLPSNGSDPSVYWEDADPTFRAWVEANLGDISQSIAGQQPQHLAAARQQAGLSTNLAQKLGELIPHVVVLGGLTAFAYMFGVVHIK